MTVFLGASLLGTRNSRIVRREAGETTPEPWRFRAISVQESPGSLGNHSTSGFAANSRLSTRRLVDEPAPLAPPAKLPPLVRDRRWWQLEENGKGAREVK